jgi:hypothetical protein
MRELRLMHAPVALKYFFDEIKRAPFLPIPVKSAAHSGRIRPIKGNPREWVKSRCGAVTFAIRFHIPLIESDMCISTLPVLGADLIEHFLPSCFIFLVTLAPLATLGVGRPKP